MLVLLMLVAAWFPLQTGKYCILGKRPTNRSNRYLLFKQIFNGVTNKTHVAVCVIKVKGVTYSLKSFLGPANWVPDVSMQYADSIRINKKEVNSFVVILISQLQVFFIFRKLNCTNV